MEVEAAAAGVDVIGSAALATTAAVADVAALVVGVHVRLMPRSRFLFCSQVSEVSSSSPLPAVDGGEPDFGAELLPELL